MKDPSEHWDDQASIYASAEGHQPFSRFLEMYEASCWNYIRPVLPAVEDSLILEAGCGTGRWVRYLAPLGYGIVLSDLSPRMVELAREKIERAGWGNQVEGYYTLDICDLNALADDQFDLVLALGGPLTLCRDARLAIQELRRVSKPGGYIVCDVANRYRTALDLVIQNRTEQLDTIMELGNYARPDGLNDHRFTPGELVESFQSNELEVTHLLGICPFFSFLPSKEEVRILEDDSSFRKIQDVGWRHAKDPAILGISGRLLMVAKSPS
jgi:SAM-dependent methyltransferase